LDQVQRVTAPRKPAVSQPLAGTPLVNASNTIGRRYFVKCIRAEAAIGDQSNPAEARARIESKSRLEERRSAHDRRAIMRIRNLFQHGIFGLAEPTLLSPNWVRLL
ncbi:hypothetical protein, partial [Mesorhizobium temperatum]|uniref:hypothetical protein n=1 Tax=Mesorhizobium temperatum TaxID=241416 RepID=UPI00197DD9AF